jgi:hypothetical protein
MIRFAENLNKMIAAGLGGALEAPRTEVAVGHRISYLESSGAVASFETNIVAPIQSLRVDMQPIQAGSGDPSPDNIRPISGRDSVTVTRTGKNLLDPSYFEERGSGIYSVTEDQLVVNRSDGQSWSAITVYALKAGTYTLSRTNAIGICAVRTSDNNYSTDAKVLQTGVTSGTFTLASDGEIKIKVGYGVSADKYPFSTGIQLELGTSATDYEPYDGASVTVQLGQTVYDGTLDVVSGKLTVDRAIKTISAINVVTTGYIKADATNGYLSDNAIYPIVAAPNQPEDLCSDYLKYERGPIWSHTGYPNCFTINVSQIHINIANDLLGITDYTQETTTTAKEKMNAYLAEHPVTLTIPIQPQTIQLTAEQLTTLKGQNNVWSDAGDVTLEYHYYEATEGY